MDKGLIDFPCNFSIKIIGNHTATLETEVFNLARHFYPQLGLDAIRSQLSKNGNYLSLTLTVYAEDQATLDHLYRAVTAHPDIQMVL